MDIVDGNYPVRFYALTNFDGSITMEADQPCEVAIKKLRNISFKLEKTKVIIKPEGYTYSMSASQRRCNIGVEKLVGVTNEYRLGTVFLRNYLTVLDYEHDMILLGINKGQESSVMHGHVYDPFDPRFMAFKATFITVYFCIVLGGVAYYMDRSSDFKHEYKSMRRNERMMNMINSPASGENSRHILPINESIDYNEALIDDKLDDAEVSEERKLSTD